MNWLDKAIEWVAPEEAYKRQVFRRSIEAESGIMMQPAINARMETGEC